MADQHKPDHDTAATTPAASGTPVTPVVPKPGPAKRVPVTSGEPDLESAKPIEGAETVETSAGTLDAATVEHVKVGGTGVVHILEKGPDVKAATDKAESEAKEHRQGVYVKERKDDKDAKNDTPKDHTAKK